MNVIPCFSAIIISLLMIIVGVNERVFDNWWDTLSTLLGTWGTLFGFMIAAASVLLTFTDGKFISILKSAGHYKTILLSFTFCCIHLFVALVIAKLFVLFHAKGLVPYAIISGISVDIIIIVGICLYLLYGVVKKVE